MRRICRHDYDQPIEHRCQMGLAIGILTIIAIVVLVLQLTSSTTHVVLR